MAVADLTSVLGALGLGSVIGQVVSGGGARRTARAAVLEVLAEVEKARWANQATWREFRAAQRGLETAALVAGVSREVVQDYLLLAEMARGASDDGYDGADDQTSGIDSRLSAAVSQAARNLSDVIWAPVGVRRLARRRGEHRVDRLIEHIEDSSLRELFVEKRRRRRGRRV